MRHSVPQLLDEYEKTRVMFAQNLAKLASEQENIEAFQTAGIMQVLRPLLVESVPSVQFPAVQALGHLISYSESLAQATAQRQIIPLLVTFLGESLLLKKAAVFALRAVAKYSPELAQEVVDSGAVAPLLGCMEVNVEMKKSTISALDAIAKHNSALATTVVEAVGEMFLPLLVMCLMDSEASVKPIAVSSLGNIAKHSAVLAVQVVDAGALPFLSEFISHSDSEVKQQACYALAQIAQHTVNLSQLVISLDIFPRILDCLKDADLHVRVNAATCILELSKQTSSIAELITNSGGAVAMVNYITAAKGEAKLPGIRTLGFLSAFTEELAMKVITSKALPPLSNAFLNEPNDIIKSAVAWAVGQMGRHSESHAKFLFDADFPLHLLAAHTNERSSDDLKAKAKRSLKSVIQMCSQLDLLQPLLEKSPPAILKYLFGQYAKLLPDHVEAQQSFEQRGGLRKVQVTTAPAESKLNRHIEAIKGLYPPEVIQRNAPQENPPQGS